MPNPLLAYLNTLTILASAAMIHLGFDLGLPLITGGFTVSQIMAIDEVHREYISASCPIHISTIPSFTVESTYFQRP